MMRFGPDSGPVVVMALPLFEEANRTRAMAVAMLRALADAGVAGALPDLPGQGESLILTQDMTLFGLREAFGGAVATIGAEDRQVHVAGIRSGTLLDPFAVARSRWYLSPQEGPALLRELTRVKQQEVGRGRRSDDLWYSDRSLPDDEPNSPVSIAGNLVSTALLSALTGAISCDAPEVPKRVVRLDGDPRPADVHLAGAPPWRRAEPGSNSELVQRLAADIATWVRRCDAR